MSLNDEAHMLPKREKPPKNPHQWRADSYICYVCGMSMQAVVEFPQLSECSPPFAPVDPPA